jgi:hypothetical protein
VTTEEIRPVKKAVAWACIIVGGLATGCIAFFSIVSVWVGFTHIHHRGSWVPIVAGTLVFGLVLWAYVRGARAIHRHLTHEEFIQL